MLRVSTNLIFQRGLDGILTRQAEASVTQQQIATGKRILEPSDDPIGITKVLNFNKQIETVEQYQKNIIGLKNRLELEENALTGVQNMLQRVRELTIQGGNDTYSTAQRATIALEVRELLSGVYDLANSTDTSGDYLFAGYQGKTQPFTISGGSYVFNGDMGQRKIRVSADRTIADSDSGFEVFMDIPTAAGGTRNLFETVESIAVALEAGTSPISILDDLELGMDNIVLTRSRVGARLSSIDEQEVQNENTRTSLEMNRSKVEDLDYAKAISEFTQSEIALEAAQKVFIKMQELSLFNFLRL
ncbi:MAG: flagellar hook-associated protein FlgL [Sedimenticola sp.]